MWATRKIAILGLLLMAALPCWAFKKHISVDTGECERETPQKVQVLTTLKFIDKSNNIQAYGQILFNRLNKQSTKAQCHVIYRLYVAEQDNKYIKVKEIATDNGDGEIAGIDLIGLSKDGSKFAANFWWGIGDAQGHQPVIYDFHTKEPLIKSSNRTAHASNGI
jgi:hypothetical protein